MRLSKQAFSPKRAKITAIEFRKDPEFIAATERKNSQKLEKLERGKLTDQEVVDGIRDIDDECKAAGPVAAFLTIRLKAHELLCKINGMFIERIELGWGEEIAKAMAEGRARAMADDKTLQTQPVLLLQGNKETEN
jgi:hypothetical protein